MKIYSGVGKTFRVKVRGKHFTKIIIGVCLQQFVGSENIREKGDTVALTCLKSLKVGLMHMTDSMYVTEYDMNLNSFFYCHRLLNSNWVIISPRPY